MIALVQVLYKGASSLKSHRPGTFTILPGTFTILQILRRYRKGTFKMCACGTKGVGGGEGGGGGQAG